MVQWFKRLFNRKLRQPRMDDVLTYNAEFLKKQLVNHANELYILKQEESLKILRKILLVARNQIFLDASRSLTEPTRALQIAGKMELVNELVHFIDSAVDADNYKKRTGKIDKPTGEQKIIRMSRPEVRGSDLAGPAF